MLHICISAGNVMYGIRVRKKQRVNKGRSVEVKKRGIFSRRNIKCRKGNCRKHKGCKGI